MSLKSIILMQSFLNLSLQFLEVINAIGDAAGDLVLVN